MHKILPEKKMILISFFSGGTFSHIDNVKETVQRINSRFFTRPAVF